MALVVSILFYPRAQPERLQALQEREQGLPQRRARLVLEVRHKG